jgi:general stress protein YciG
MQFQPVFHFKEYKMASNQGSKSGTSNRGFASMDPARQREIASEGGRAAHEKGTAHEFTSEEAREAGRKGGMARSQNRMRAQASNGGFGGNSGNSGSNSNQSDSGSSRQSNMGDQAEE